MKSAENLNDTRNRIQMIWPKTCPLPRVYLARKLLWRGRMWVAGLQLPLVGSELALVHCGFQCGSVCLPGVPSTHPLPGSFGQLPSMIHIIFSPKEGISFPQDFLLLLPHPFFHAFLPSFFNRGFWNTGHDHVLRFP